MWSQVSAAAPPVQSGDGSAVDYASDENGLRRGKCFKCDKWAKVASLLMANSFWVAAYSSATISLSSANNTIVVFYPASAVTRVRGSLK